MSERVARGRLSRSRATCFRECQPPRHGQQIVQRISIEPRQPSQHDWILPVIVGDVVRVRRIVEEPRAILEGRSDYECIGFSRTMPGHAGHEKTAQCQHRRSVVSDGVLDFGEREPDLSDARERIRRRYCSSSSLHSITSSPAGSWRSTWHPPNTPGGPSRSHLCQASARFAK